MKSAFISLIFFPLVFGAEFLVGVGKDETTGKKGVGFDPSSIHPIPGDIIAFEFRSGSHSVVQSSFENPCTGMDGGFNSGVQTVSNDLPVDAPGLPTVRLTINSTDPIWFFDEAGGQCSQGGVLSVNPTASQTDAAFKANAAKASPAPPSSTSSESSQSASSSSTTSTSGAPGTSSGAPSTISNAAIHNGFAASPFSGLGVIMAVYLGLW